MSITIYGEVLVPADMSQASIKELQDAIDGSELRGEVCITVDVDRDVHFMFGGTERVLSKGLKLPHVSVGYWCDMGADPFFYETGYDRACLLVSKLGYAVHKHRE